MSAWNLFLRRRSFARQRAKDPQGLKINSKIGYIIDNIRALFIHAWNYSTKEKCPNCTIFGGKRAGRAHICFKHRPGVVTQEERRYDRNGEFVGSTERDVHVIKKIEIYDQKYKCYACNHEWKLRLERDLTDLYG